jgi:hypothetical protein
MPILIFHPVELVMVLSCVFVAVRVLAIWIIMLDSAVMDSQ